MQEAGARPTSRSVQSAPGGLPSASSTENIDVKFCSCLFDSPYIEVFSYSDKMHEQKSDHLLKCFKVLAKAEAERLLMSLRDSAELE